MKLYFSIWHSLSGDYFVNCINDPTTFVCNIKELDFHLNNPNLAVFKNRTDAELYALKCTDRNHIWEVDV